MAIGSLYLRRILMLVEKTHLFSIDASEISELANLLLRKIIALLKYQKWTF